MPADVEDKYIIAQASEPIDKDGKFVNKRIRVRHKEEVQRLTQEKLNTWMFHQNN